MYRKHFSTQLTLNLERSIFTDALFCAIYFKLTAESPLETLPSMREDIDLMRPFIEQQLLRVYEADSTRQVLKIVEDLMDGLEEVLDKDMHVQLFVLNRPPALQAYVKTLAPYGSAAQDDKQCRQ